MSKSNNFIFKGLKIVAWVIFVGLCIEAGGLIVNFIFSLYKPEFVQNLYQKLDLSEMYERSKWAFFSMNSFILVISILKAVLFYVVVILVSEIDLSKPFNSFVSRQISQISYYTFSIGILSYIARQSAKNLQHHGYVINNLDQFWADSQAFILMAAVIYVIATIFSKGVEMQKENDLTVWTMPIIVNLDVMMAKRKISLNELSERVDLTISNLSILKTGKAKAIRFSTLDAICKALDCQPGDILEYGSDDKKHSK